MGKNTLLLKKILTVILFSVAAVNFIWPVFQNRSIFLEKFNVAVYEKKYNHSQYVIPQSKTPISDEELLSYAGYRYATGLNPILINSDHPPLGKYIIGWFTLLTGNNRVVSLFFALGSILVLVSIVCQLTRSSLLSTLAFFFASLDSVFLDQIIYSPVLDIIQLFFFLLYAFIFIAWIKTKKRLLILPLGLSLGALSATKLYFPAFIVAAVTFLFILIVEKKLFTSLILSSIIVLLSFITYTASYAQYFILGNSFRQFLGVQKWIFLFWKNNSIQVAKYYGSVIPLLLFNQWKVWWGNKQYIHFAHWTIFWPVFFILGLACIVYFLSKGISSRNNLGLSALFLSVWSIVFAIYLCFIPISPRYLMLLYFPLYILICLFIKSKYKKYV